MNDAKFRAKELLSRMTLNEKVGQLAQHCFGFQTYDRDENGEVVLTEEFKNYVLQFGGLGMLYGLFRADPWSKRTYKNGGIVAEEREKVYNLVQKFIIENTRLKIPVLMEDEAPHGRQVLDSVIYPVSLNVGCSFNPDLYRKQTEQIATECKLGGMHVPYFSVFDVAVDPRWGRFEECFSEDPYLASKMSENAVKGAHDCGSMVCCKHYLAQGSAVGGHNGGVSNIGEREVREIHLPPAESAVKAGCEFVMATYSEIDGEPCHASEYYLKTVLRDELGFTGVVKSDGCAVDRLSDFCEEDMVKAGAVAVKSGVDCGLFGVAMTHLEEAVEKGYVSEEQIDQAVLRLLEKKFACGVMDKPYLDEKGQSIEYLKSGKGQKIAYEMASESLVLLKNEGVLPFKDKRVVIIGGNLDNIYYMLGDYTPQQKGKKTIKDVFCENGVEYLQGWTFEDGITASDEEIENAVKNADVILFGCGGSSVRDFESEYNDAGAIIQAKGKYMDCGEGCDLAELKLANCQIALLEKLSKFNKPIASLILAGRAYVLTDIIENSSAAVWCGYPGQEGASAIYDTLCGKINKFGRLSFSLPRSVGQLPICYNSKYSSKYVDITDKPLYAFGYGLSYSDFEYYNFLIKEASIDDILNDRAKIEISFDIKNVSGVEGKEIPQLYIYKSGGTVTHRLKELKDFEKINLLPNETKTINFTLGYDELKEWSTAKKYKLLPCKLYVSVARASDNVIFKKELVLK